MSTQSTLAYCTYDVFTDSIFGGNPLAVVWDADQLTTEDMQNIAREFNYSESVFILAPKNAAHTARLRIFTPTQELPFAGHPTIGAIVALAERSILKGAKLIFEAPPQDMSLELGIGILTANFARGRASFHATQSLEYLAEPDSALIAQVLGLDAADILNQPEMISLGVPFTFTQVASRAALAKVQIDIQAMRQGNTAYPSGRDFSQVVYWSAPTEDGQKTIHMRMFAPLDSIPEDPATGSAAAALATLLFEKTQNDVSFTVHQGEDMGRPSRIDVTADASGVTLYGTAKKVMDGHIYL